MKYNTESYGLLRSTYQKFRYGFCARPANYITSPFRVLPDFFIIGVARSGTTSLFHYLGQHPNIERASYDELGYFDENFHLGLNWYRSLFPTKFTKKNIEKIHKKFLTFDVTPFYIYNSLVIQRILADFPNSKIIANLRNPIDRAYSNFNQGIQDNNDTETTFEEVVYEELDKIKNNKINLADPSSLVDNFYELHLARGLYEMQLKPWYNSFSHDKILVTSSEQLATNTAQTLKQIFNFLKIPDVKVQDLSKKNKRQYPIMKKETRKLLVDFYRPYNEKLYSLIGTNFDWDK